MKITKQQLRKIVKEELLKELTGEEAAMMPSPSGTDQGIQIVRQHLQEIVVELAEGGLDPHLPSTLAGTGHTGAVTLPGLDGLADEMYRMIMRELGA